MKIKKICYSSIKNGTSLLGLALITSILISSFYLPKKAFAASCSWIGSNGNWETPSNWSCGGAHRVPNAGDDVIINETVTVDLNSTTTINSLTIGNTMANRSPTLNFNYDAIIGGALLISGGDLTVYSNALITHSAAIKDQIVGRININVLTGSADIEGMIHARYKGYSGGSFLGESGYGPGAGTAALSEGGGGGGGYGGKGGDAIGIGGSTYGNYASIDLGSGGGAGRDASGDNVASGGAGGGSISLNVFGNLVLNGSIIADGESPAQNVQLGGSGSGGSIHISAASLSGYGMIDASGGESYFYSGSMIPGWEYSETVYLSESTPSSDYIVKVDLSPINFDYYNTKLDGGDIRFIDNNYNELDYWIENWSKGGNSTIWVKVQDAGTTEINICHSNPDAITTSNESVGRGSGDITSFFIPSAGGGGGGRILLSIANQAEYYGTTTVFRGNGGVNSASGTIHSPNPGYITNLSASLNSFKGTDWTTNLGNPANSFFGVEAVGISTTSGRRIAEFNLFFDGNRDLGNVTADIDINEKKSFFHIPGGFSNIDGGSAGSTYTLYVPRSQNDNIVRICPGVSSFNEITESCSGGYNLNQTDSNVSIVMIEGQSYFKISGLSSTGGMGMGTSGTPNMRVDLANDNMSGTDDIEVWFDTPTNLTSNSLIYIIYESVFTGGSSITTSDVTVNCDDDGLVGGTSTGLTTVTVGKADNGYLELDMNTDTCSTWIEVDINGGGGNHLTNPGSSGNYSWAVVTDVGGNGIDDDSGAVLAYVGDDNDVNITAIVPPVIDMELFQTGTDTEMVDPNTCSLGVLSLNTVNTCRYDIGTGTNNSTGVSVYMESDGSLNDALGNTIDNTTGIVTAGTEEYGFYVRENGGGEYVIAGSYNTAHQIVPTSATLIASTSTTGSGTTVGSTGQHIEIEHAASMDVSTIVGTYNQLVTYTAFTN